MICSNIKQNLKKKKIWWSAPNIYVHEFDYTDCLWFITLLKAAFNMAIHYALAKINKDNLHLK